MGSPRLREEVAAFRGRSLKGDAYAYVFLLDCGHLLQGPGQPAGGLPCRRGRHRGARGRAPGGARVRRRRLLGSVGEDGAFWTAFLRSLKARGLHGVQLVISDAHEGLKSAVGAAMTGAAWQRCRVHSCATC